MQYQYTTSEFAELLRTAMPSLLEYDLSDEALVQDYFEQNPDEEQMALVAPIAITPTEEPAPPPVPTSVESVEESLAWIDARNRKNLLGVDALPGFWKQLGHNLEKHMDSLKSQVP